MKKIVFISITLLASVISIMPAHAGGPWTPEKKGSFFQLQTTFPAYATKRLFTSSGEDLYLPRPVVDLTFQAYLEYGLTDKFGLSVNLPCKYVASLDKTISKSDLPNALPSGSLFGLGNSAFRLKYKLIEKKWLAAVSVQAEIPAYATAPEKGMRTGFETWVINPMLHIGKSFSNGIYTYVDAGPAIRTGDYSNEIRAFAEAGKKVGKYFNIALALDLRETLRDKPDNLGNYRYTGLFVNNQEYFSYGAKFSMEKNGTGLNFSTFGAAYGNYVAKAPFFNLGVFKKW